METDLTATEHALVEHVRRGEVFAPGSPDGGAPVLRASVLRDIARGRLATDADPHGLCVRGALVEGRLDLDHIGTDLPLVFDACRFPAGLTARGARLSMVVLRDCVVGSSEPSLGAIDLGSATIAYTLRLTGTRIGNAGGFALNAGNLRLGENLWLNGGFTATGSDGYGVVRLDNAQVEGDVIGNGATITNESGPALQAEGFQAGHAMLFRDGFTATGAGRHGAVALLAARAGSVEFVRAVLRNDSGPALMADRFEVAHAFLLDDTTVAGSGEVAAMRLDGAAIGSQAAFPRSTVTNDSGSALSAEGASITGSVFLCPGFSATGAGDAGAVRLLGARLGGTVDVDGAVLCNDSGPAFVAVACEIGQGLRMRDGFTATGTVDLANARITGPLECTGARLDGGSEPALDARKARISGNLLLWDTTADSASEASTIQLRGVHVEGQLDARGATVGNSRGPAFEASVATIEQDLFLRDGFSASGAGEDRAAVLLVRSRIAGQVAMDGATVGNPAGPAVSAYHLKVGQRLFLDEGLSIRGGGTGKVLNLSDARADGGLSFQPKELTHAADPGRRLSADGLRYTGLPTGIGTDAWLELLRSGTAEYTAQPYQHLAAAHRAAGHDREARRVLMAQRRDQVRRRALTGRGERAWARFTGVTLGYGYQPWRALVGFVATVAVSVLLAVLLGGAGGLTAAPAGQYRTEARAAPAAVCPPLDRVGAGLDLGTPLLSTRARCEATGTAVGQALTVGGWLLRLLAWTFATLFVAGFTGAVRKN
ncbi:hypothetical protein [Amycolatopsis sp. NPDC058986]|uniref:hypothetical protein n=1 Tax=unclassified Amycolatopsis TaxID=2618356 RepID=UPI00366ABAD2